jgi:hypothetical protein
MSENDNSKDVTGREFFKVVVQDQRGDVFLSLDTQTNLVSISDDPCRLRDALKAVDELSKFISQWITFEPLPRKDIGVNGTEVANKI